MRRSLSQLAVSLLSVAAGTLLTAQSTVQLGPTAQIDLPGRLVAPPSVAELDVFLQEVVRPQGIVNSDDRWPEFGPDIDRDANRDLLRRWARAVGHVLTPRRGGTVPCTTFFFADHSLMTASHCVSSVQEAAGLTVHMPDGRTIPGAEVSLLMVQGDLDFTVLFVTTPQPALEKLVFRAAAASTFLLWQEPSRGERLLSKVGCEPPPSAAPVTPPAGRLGHRCDSVGGASGSPLQASETGQVIGLHTAGCPGAANRSDRCVNFATEAEDIRSRILGLEAQLRAANPVAADEVIAAVR